MGTLSEFIFIINYYIILFISLYIYWSSLFIYLIINLRISKIQSCMPLNQKYNKNINFQNKSCLLSNFVRLFPSNEREYNFYIVWQNIVEVPISAVSDITTLSLALCGGVALLALAACGLVLCARDTQHRPPPLTAYHTDGNLILFMFTTCV